MRRCCFVGLEDGGGDELRNVEFLVVREEKIEFLDFLEELVSFLFGFEFSSVSFVGFRFSIVSINVCILSL